MSQYTPNLERNGIQWYESGNWKQGQDIVHLQTFAEKMIVPPENQNLDILNSIPTPWSRLLLFESALFNPEHPSHTEILSQWRGLLGLLALANPLGINLSPGSEDMIINLNDFAPQSLIAKTFLDLRPSYKIGNKDVETGKWNSFHFISVDGHILGATSPRTLVFTGVSQTSSCAAAIPFCEDGHLYDPLKYYEKFNDQKYLALLQSWLQTFINRIENNQELINWLGTFPAPAGTAPQGRHDKILGLFRTWLNEVNLSVSAETQIPQIGQLHSHFTLPNYKDLLFLPEIPYDPASDLLLDTEKVRDKTVVVCYRPAYEPNPKKNSMLYNERNQRIQSDKIKISDGRWVKADEILPEKINFLPADWELISDPVEELFEDKLIEISLPAAEDTRAAYSLALNVKNFLFPFKQKILNYFEPAEIYRYTKISVEPNQGYHVTLELPLRGGGRKILAARFYEESNNELMILNGNNDHRTSELAMWPKFKSPNWNYHYYFKRSLADIEVDFTPVFDDVPRSNPDKSAYWYFSNTPISAFIGVLQGNKGLLLPKYEELAPQARTDFWNVAVDFGSTHTRAFYLQMEPLDGDYTRVGDARVESLSFTTYAKQLTTCDAEQLKDDFFALEGKIIPSERAELKTLLMRPVEDRVAEGEWYPREGFGYLHWIHSGFDSRKIKSDIKWEGTGNNDDLRSYLRWLMVQILAEAVQKNARVVKVLRSYPSSFSRTLKAHHNAEWVDLAGFIKVPVGADEDELLSEAVATARYLTDREDASPIVNTISFDVGGSTTDIAIWYGKPNENRVLTSTLGAQESVKMATGIVGKYLQTDAKAMDFLEWFVSAVNNQNNNLGSISLSAFERKRNGYALMFYNILSYYEQGGKEMEGNLGALIGLLKAEVKATGLLAHIIYLFGSLVYYSGQLSRKVGLQETQTPTYYVYFCGKGGTLIRWIDRHEAFVKRLFIAGLYGPDSPVAPEQQNKVNVEVKISKRPKEEVGRGLLVKFTYQKQEKEESFGLFDLRAPSVTVGETGYTINSKELSSNAQEEAENHQPPDKLNWNDKLDEEVMRRLNSKVPSFNEMKELNHFVRAISEAFKVQDERSPVFDFEGILNNDNVKSNFVTAVTARLFNPNEDGLLFKLQKENDPGALVEPLIITEMKVLLEFLSNNKMLFK